MIRSHAGERGAVAVEAALIIPFLVLLAFGMIETAWLIRDHVAVTTLAREGARTASAESRLTGFSADAASAVARSAESLDFSRIELWIYKSTTANGLPPACTVPLSDGTYPVTDTCERYIWRNPAGVVPGQFILSHDNDPLTPYPGPTWSATNMNACIVDPDNVDRRDYVGVYVKARHDWLTGIFPGTGATVKSRTVMRFEPVLVPPATVCR